MFALSTSSSWSVFWPFMSWFPKVTTRDVRADLVAALTGAIIVLPQGVAFATIAGMPPEYGLYAGMVPAIVAALFGSSRHLVSGPTTAASVVLFSSLSLMAAPGTPDYVSLALTLTLMVGLIELGLGLARLGALVNFISHSVVVGFTAGAAFLIAAKQFKHFFGIEMDSGGHFHEILMELGRHVIELNPTATLVAAATLAIGIAVRVWVPKVPYMIAAMIGGSLLALLLNNLGEGASVATIGSLAGHLSLPAALDFSLSDLASAMLVILATLGTGVAVRTWAPRLPAMVFAVIGGGLAALLLINLTGSEATTIATVGALPASLPPLSAPSFALNDIKELAPTALAVTLFALTEAVSIGRSLAARGGYRIDGNQEFVGQGLSNIAGAFFSGYVATGSFNRSGVNYEAGARTPLASIFAALMLMVIVLLVAPLASYLPKAAMAGVLMLVAWGLIDRKEIRHILHASRRETAIMLVTFLSALFLELEFAIFAGVLLSLILYLVRTSKPRVETLTPDPRLPNRAFSHEGDVPQCPQLRFVRIAGSLFFGSVAHVERAFDLLRARFSGQKHLAIVADGINFVDLQGGQTLVDEAKRRDDSGGGLYLINVKPGLWDTLESYGFIDDAGGRNMFQSKEAAVHAIYQKLDKSICENCDKRIFWECHR